MAPPQPTLGSSIVRDRADPGSDEPVRRRWRLSESRLRMVLAGVAVLGLLLTGGGVVLARKAPGVFYSRVQVRFISPLSTANPNGLNISPISIVMTAGVVAELVDPRILPRPNDENVTIVGQGIRDGWTVTLPRSGGQFVPFFSEPWVDVQVAGPSPEEVVAQVKKLVLQVNSTLTAIEVQAHAKSTDLIRTKVLPDGEPPVTYMHGSPSRAGVAVLLLGIGLTWALMSLIRRFAR